MRFAVHAPRRAGPRAPDCRDANGTPEFCADRFLTRGIYRLPKRCKSGYLESARRCNLLCNLTPSESGSNLISKRVKGPNPTIVPFIFSSPAAARQASNILMAWLLARGPVRACKTLNRSSSEIGRASCREREEIAVV